ADAILRARFAFCQEALLFRFWDPLMQRFAQYWGTRGVIGYVDPFDTALCDLRRRRALQSLNAQPDGPIAVGYVAFNARQTSEFVLMEYELRAVGQFVLRQPCCHALVELHERLDIVEQPGQPFRRQPVIGGNIFMHVQWGSTI